jgi:hypothetical protein
MQPPADGSSLNVIGATLEGVDLGPSEPARISYDNNDPLHHGPVGLTSVIDPATSSDALQPLQPSTGGTAESDSIFGSKGSFNYLFSADGNDTIEGPTDPEIINGGRTGFKGSDHLLGGGSDDIIVYHTDAFIDGSSEFDIVRVDDGALDLYQSDDTVLSSSSIDLGNASMFDVDMILITEDASADSKRGTVFDAGTADRTPRSQGSESESPANLYIVGSKGDTLTLLDFGGDWADGNGDVPGIQPVGHVSDGQGQSSDIYQIAADNFGRVTNVYVDTDIQVTIEQVGA